MKELLGAKHVRLVREARQLEHRAKQQDVEQCRRVSKVQREVQKSSVRFMGGGEDADRCR